MSTAAFILSPTTFDDFRAQYWSAKPLHICRNDPDFYSRIFTIPEFQSLLARAYWRWGEIQLANHAKSANWVDVSSFGSPSSKLLMRAYRQGDTVILNDAHLYSEPLGLLCHEFEELSGFPVNANAYLTPPRSAGLPPHSDDQEIIILQIAGEKTWSFPGNSISDETLTAGGLLYIPRGTKHSATTNEDCSLHLSISLAAITYQDFILGLVSQVTRDLAHVSLPMAFRQFDTLIIDNALSRLASAQDRTVALQHFQSIIAQSLSELRTFEDRCWVFDARKELRETSRVRVLYPTSNLTVLSSDCIKLFYPGTVLSLPRSASEMMAFIVSKHEFTIAEVSNSQDLRPIIVLIERLIEEGFCEIVE